MQTLREGEKMSEEYPSCFNETYRKARKLHICCECRQEIKPGDRYRYTSGIWRDKPEAFKQCETCAAIFDACVDLARENDHFPDEYPSYSDLIVFVTEEISGYPESIKRFDFANNQYWLEKINNFKNERNQSIS